MKKRSRDINVFSMSALDLFASAMGAFIIVTLVVMPYFPNTGDSKVRVAEVQAELRACEATLDETTAKFEAARSDLERAESSLQTCQKTLKRTFVLVVISWGTEDDDVDLHVVDPAGNEFFYKNPRFPGSDAALEEDSQRGPGNEIWLHPNAEPGEYKVYANLYAARSKISVEVRGSVLHQDGRVGLSDVILTRQEEKLLMAIVVVDSDGIIEVR